LKGLRLAGAAAILLLLSSAPTSAATPKAAAPVANGSWTVYHHDNAHTGYDSAQPATTGAAAGWVSTTLDGTILAEPLVFNGIVYTATLQGTVYAINQADGTVAWSINVGTPKSWSNQCGNINPLGISGTPVIDAAANRIYVTENLAADSAWHVFAVDLATHMKVMDTTIPTSLGTGLDWTIEQERGALALANGNVYVPFGGRIGDCGAYHGWIFAVPINGAAVTSYYETPGQGAGFWAAGGVVVDDSTGKVFETSGNGTSSGCNANTNGTPVYENDAVVRLSATLAHEDAFIPLDWKNNWCANDQDLGSASMVLISPTLAFQSGKWGNGFLVNPQALGGVNGQIYPSPTNYTPVDVCRGNHSDANFGSYAYAAPYVYLSCEGNGLVALQVNTTTNSFSACASTCASPSWNATGFSPGPPIVAGGAVWAVDTGGGGLYGFNASTGAQIYHSTGFGVNHFTTPSEAGGQIFVAAGDTIRSFNMINGCSSVTLSAAPPNQAPWSTPVTLTAAATGPNCVSPQYQYWVMPPSGSWTMLQDYSASSTFTWTTPTANGNYYLGVHAKALASTAPFESVASIPYTVTPPHCASVTLSANPASGQPSGTPVTFTAAAAGCPNATYEFWARWQGYSSWQLLQGYSSNATYVWNSTGALTGTEYFGVWVCGASCTPSTYDTYTSVPFSVAAPSCASVTASAVPASVVHGAGTHVTITGAASGCTSANPRYEFWMRAASQSYWQLVQGYSTTAAYDWNSTGALAGTVYFGVWVKDANSPNLFDTFVSTAVTVT
jgi:hypothetical protein